jgi:trk system potassium uptake protein TrkA
LADRPRRRTVRHDEEILVIGLGRFGGRLALELVALGHDVLGVDLDPDIVQHYAPLLTKVMAADTTRPEVLEQIGATEFNHVVVGVGDVEASILTVAELVTLGVRDIWAKAMTDSHKRILEKVGATHVVLPEHEMGRRIAHQVTGKVVDYIELDEGFALVETRVPRELWGRTLGESQVRANYGVTVVFVKPGGHAFTYATPDSRLDEDCLVLVAGDIAAVEAFAEAT